MSEREENAPRGDVPAANETNDRQRAPKGAEQTGRDDSEHDESEESTTSRPRGHTEDPDRTL